MGGRLRFASFRFVSEMLFPVVVREKMCEQYRRGIQASEVGVAVHSATIPGREERIMETEMQAGPRRQDTGTRCRQYRHAAQ